MTDAPTDTPAAAPRTLEELSALHLGAEIEGALADFDAPDADLRDALKDVIRLQILMAKAMAALASAMSALVTENQHGD